MHTRHNKRARFSDTSIPKQLDDKSQELASVQRGGCHGLHLVHGSAISFAVHLLLFFLISPIAARPLLGQWW
jgi:hypothetical protein